MSSRGLGTGPSGGIFQVGGDAPQVYVPRVPSEVYNGGRLPPELSQSNCSPDTNVLQWQQIDTQAGAARVNLLLNWQPAITTIYFMMGYTGSPGLFVSVEKVNSAVEVGGVLVPVGAEHWFFLEPSAAGGTDTPITTTLANYRVSFRKPISQLYVHHKDYGTGGFLVFLGTDDVEYGVNR